MSGSSRLPWISQLALLQSANHACLFVGESLILPGGSDPDTAGDIVLPICHSHWVRYKMPLARTFPPLADQTCRTMTSPNSRALSKQVPPISQLLTKENVLSSCIFQVAIRRVPIAPKVVIPSPTYVVQLVGKLVPYHESWKDIPDSEMFYQPEYPSEDPR